MCASSKVKKCGRQATCLRVHSHTRHGIYGPTQIEQSYGTHSSFSLSSSFAQEHNWRIKPATVGCHARAGEEREGECAGARTHDEG